MTVKILVGDAHGKLRGLPDKSVHCCVTSPPYWGLRDYGVDGQIGLEETIDAYVPKLVEIFREVRRVLRDDGTLWLNLGDSYAGSWGAQSRDHAGKHAPNVSAISANQVKASTIRASGTGSLGRTPGCKPKDLVGAPWMLAFALRADGWYLRSDIIWHKPNPMPESVRDRPTNAHEHLFLLSKSRSYWYDSEAICDPVSGTAHARRKDGQRLRAKGEHGTFNRRAGTWSNNYVPDMRNARSVWSIATESFSEAHFATFPTELARRCIAAGTSERGCCSDCGMPWCRMVEENRPDYERRPGSHGRAYDGNGHAMATKYRVKRSTMGWEAGCDCGAEERPCVVLDPFGGAGTTGLVADRLERDAILIELNPEYADMAKKRIESDGGLFSNVGIDI